MSWWDAAARSPMSIAPGARSNLAESELERETGDEAPSTKPTVVFSYRLTRDGASLGPAEQSYPSWHAC
jgi:hypothetical protein